MDQTSNPILEKIRKLLSKAEGTDNELEANTFFSKAQELMEKYAIDEALARQSPNSPSASFKIVTTRINFPEDTSQVTRAKRSLLYTIAMCNRCTSYYEQARANDYRVNVVVGTEADIQFVNMLFHSILIQMDGELLKGFQSETKKPTPPKPSIPSTGFDFLAEAADIDPAALKSFTKRTYRPEFIEGYTQRVSQRIREAHKARQQDNENTNSMALVVLKDNKTAIDEHLAANGVQLRAARSLTRYNTNDYARSAGANAANRADLGNSKLSNNRKELN